MRGCAFILVLILIYLLLWLLNSCTPSKLHADCRGSNDSTAIYQEVFFGAGSWHLVTTDGSSYDNVVHGDSAYIQLQKPIEFNKALAKRKPVAIIKIKCQ